MANKNFSELLDEMMGEIMETIGNMDNEKDEAMEIAKHTKILFDAYMEVGFDREESLKLVIATMNM